MPKKFVPNWNDDVIRPENADSQIGWAGVPLADTLGYYGVIKRAVIPTNDHLGFDPDYASVDAEKLAASFMKKFAPAVESQDLDSIKDLIAEDGHWKDIMLLTWDVRTLRGHENILPMLRESLPRTAIKNIRINPEVKPVVESLGEDLSFVLFHIEFEFAHGTGVAVLRLSPLNAKPASDLADPAVWKIFTIGTSLETVEGWDPEFGDKIRYEKGKVVDPQGKARSYRELREAEVNGEDNFDPAVIIVGAGHCGLTMAARLKVLGIPHLVVEKEDRVGYSWANRYKSLSLHGPTFTNHLPCVPFLNWFPIFLPAEQLAEFLKHYAGIMDLNIWTNATIDGPGAVYDEEKGNWTVSVQRGDGTRRVFHPRHIMLATGISGTLPNVPKYPGMAEFESNGGRIVHSSRHRTGPDWKGKKCIVVGAATSAHDIAYELHENGCDVTMIQRSGTHVMSVEKGIRHFYKNRELTNRRGGPPIDLADQWNFLRHPFTVEYELLARVQQKGREIDQDLLNSLKEVGYRLHDGYHGGGAYSLVFFDYGRYYWDTGCCKLICDGKVQLTHSEIDHFTDNGVVYKDGTTQEADVVVFATGYLDSKSSIQAIMGDEMAKKCNERWEKGNGFFIGPEGDSVILYRPLAQRGLYSMFHQFSFNRFYSHRLALRIKAEELGIDVTPYGNKPTGPPSVAAGRQPRPEGVPF
ncbi:hypothetical protein BDV18DRAFT_156161 [Aspergillus unguis]